MNAWSILGRLGTVTLAAGLLATAVSAAPVQAAPQRAAAAVAGLVQVQAVSASNSLSKSISVRCPVGKRVYSAGGQITGGVGNVYMDDVTPSDDLSSVRVTGWENGAYAANWTVTAFAICGSPVLNLQRISFQSGTNGLATKRVTATCPAGTRLYGLGGEVSGGNGNVFMDRLLPNATLTQATASATENAPDASWNLIAYAICGSAPAGLQLVGNRTPVNSFSSKSVTVACPVGKKLIGSGGEIAGRNGRVILDDLTPSTAGNSVRTSAYENGPVPTSWSLAAYGICAL